MGIDLKKMRALKFKDRTEEVPVPMYNEASKNGKAVWIIRGLSGEELYAVREAVTRAANTEELMAKVLSGEVKEKVQAALDLLGLGDQLPDEYIRRLNILRLGSVDPKVSHEDAKQLALDFPILFNELTDKIQNLTGMGRTLGESKPSGQIQK